MDTYCWIHGTFSVPGAWSGQQGVEVPHPGVAPPGKGEEVVYHKYYQWVCYVLFLQVSRTLQYLQASSLHLIDFRLVFSTCHDSSGRTLKAAV